MARRYTLGKRAEQQAGTRQRIVEAALDLHTQVGPANTTVSMVAERAGVQRHTFYAHFPDDRSLFAACSGLVTERDPLPDISSWRTIDDPAQRLRTGLAAVYGWFSRNAQLLSSVLRDAETHAITRETAERQFAPFFAELHDVLGKELTAAQRPLLHLALSFFTFRTLTRDSGLSPDAAVSAMLRAIASAKKD